MSLLKKARFQDANLFGAKLDSLDIKLARAGGAIGLDAFKVAKVDPKKKPKPLGVLESRSKNYPGKHK